MSMWFWLVMSQYPDFCLRLIGNRTVIRIATVGNTIQSVNSPIRMFPVSMETACPPLLMLPPPPLVCREHLHLQCCDWASHPRAGGDSWSAHCEHKHNLPAGGTAQGGNHCTVASSAQGSHCRQVKVWRDKIC